MCGVKKEIYTGFLFSFSFSRTGKSGEKEYANSTTTNNDIDISAKKPPRKRGRPPRNCDYEWEESDTFRLIELWSKEELLYNTSDIFYMHRDFRAKSLTTICTALKRDGVEQCSLGEVRSKMNNLRNYYAAEKRKETKTEYSELPYKSNWKFYNHLTFLDHSYRPRMAKRSYCTSFTLNNTNENKRDDYKEETEDPDSNNIENTSRVSSPLKDENEDEDTSMSMDDQPPTMVGFHETANSYINENTNNINKRYVTDTKSHNRYDVSSSKISNSNNEEFERDHNTETYTTTATDQSPNIFVVAPPTPHQQQQETSKTPLKKKFRFHNIMQPRLSPTDNSDNNDIENNTRNGDGGGGSEANGGEVYSIQSSPASSFMTVFRKARKNSKLMYSMQDSANFVVETRPVHENSPKNFRMNRRTSDDVIISGIEDSNGAARKQSAQMQSAQIKTTQMQQAFPHSITLIPGHHHSTMIPSNMFGVRPTLIPVNTSVKQSSSASSTPPEYAYSPHNTTSILTTNNYEKDQPVIKTLNSFRSTPTTTTAGGSSDSSSPSSHQNLDKCYADLIYQILVSMPDSVEKAMLKLDFQQKLIQLKYKQQQQQQQSGILEVTSKKTKS